MAQGQISVMTGSLGPDLLFETLISNFDPIQKDFFLDRHFAWRSHDPTPGIWSTFVKRN